MKNTKTSLKGVVILLLTALIWGISFVSQSVGAESVEPFTFMGIRTFMGATVLLPIVLIRDKKIKKDLTSKQLADFKRNNKKTIFYGIILGLFLSAATNFQQFAFNYSSAGKIAFITATYMFFVPIVGLFFKKRVPFVTWICVAFGFLGLFLLCFPKGSDFGDINKGDVLSLICALFFCGQILLIEKFSPSCDGIKLSCVQFYTDGIITLILMFIFETPKWNSIKSAALPLLYSGIMSCGIAYTLQVIGQKYCEATVASLIMCMESVFATLSAAIILHESLTPQEIIGCVVMFSAIIFSQLFNGLIEKKKSNENKS